MKDDKFVIQREISIKSYEILRDSIWGIARSKSEPDTLHTVSIRFGNDDTRGFYCDCKAGYYNPEKPCKHVQELLHIIEREELIGILLKSISKE